MLPTHAKIHHMRMAMPHHLLGNPCRSMAASPKSIRDSHTNDPVFRLCSLFNRISWVTVGLPWPEAGMCWRDGVTGAFYLGHATVCRDAGVPCRMVRLTQRLSPMTLSSRSNVCGFVSALAPAGRERGPRPSEYWGELTQTWVSWD
jgi:hypothetical protein